MLKALFKFEEVLLRVETWLLVSCVLLMLVLAGYTVFYRNVLIPWQNHLSTSGPPVSQATDEPVDGPAEDDDSDDEFGGGFGGGFGEDDESDEDDEVDGFGGGFGGGFGDEEEGDDDDDSGGFGGGFGPGDDPAEAEGVASRAVSEPQPSGEPDSETEGGPPPEGSPAAWLVDLIDAIKAHWTDALLRQLVIICGFLGAMLAARQRSHITIDAVGTLLEGRPRHIVDTLTSVVAGVVCVFLALSGLRLVELGLEFPRQLLPFAKEWQIQLAFPIGWSLLAFHFIVRGIESAHLARTHQPRTHQQGGDSADEEST